MFHVLVNETLLLRARLAVAYSANWGKSKEIEFRNIFEKKLTANTLKVALFQTRHQCVLGARHSEFRGDQ